MRFWKFQVLVVSFVSGTLAHTGGSESHHREAQKSGLESLMGAYPPQTLGVVIAEMAVVAVLTFFAVRHYRKNS